MIAILIFARVSKIFRAIKKRIFIFEFGRTKYVLIRKLTLVPVMVNAKWVVPVILAFSLCSLQRVARATKTNKEKNKRYEYIHAL